MFQKFVEKFLFYKEMKPSGGVLSNGVVRFSIHRLQCFVHFFYCVATSQRLSNQSNSFPEISESVSRPFSQRVRAQRPTTERRENFHDDASSDRRLLLFVYYDYYHYSLNTLFQHANFHRGLGTKSQIRFALGTPFSVSWRGFPFATSADNLLRRFALERPTNVDFFKKYGRHRWKSMGVHLQRSGIFLGGGPTAP